VQNFVPIEASGIQNKTIHREYVGEDGARIAFCDGQREAVVDFDYSHIDDLLQGNPFPEESPMATAGDGLGALLRWCWAKHGEDGTQNERLRVTLKTSFRRFIVLSILLHPDLLDGMTFEEVAKRIGCTKSSLSKTGIQFSKHFGMHFRRQRRVSGVEAMRQSRNKFYKEHSSPKKGKRNNTTAQPQEAL